MTARIAAMESLIISLDTPNNPQLTPRGMDYAAPYPGRTYPCQRFAHTITNVYA